MTDASGSMGTMTSQVSFRTGVADRLTIGGVRLHNVSFTVLPDNTEPWSLLPLERRGLIGIPVILAFQTLRWGQDGTMRIATPASPLNVQDANLILDNDHLAVKFHLAGRTALAALDTGAINTDLYRGLALKFPSLLQAGKKTKAEIRGVGGAESYESVLLAELPFQIGEFHAILRNTSVLMDRSVRSYAGNFGMDVLKQGTAFKIDFTAMKLELEDR